MKRRQAQRAGDEEREAGQHRRAMIEAPVQQRGVGGAHQLEAPVEQVVHAPDEALAARRSPCSPRAYSFTSGRSM